MKKAPCLVGLAHHWMVGPPTYRHVGSIETGKLLEVTRQVCKYCGAERENTCEVILDEDG